MNKKPIMIALVMLTLAALACQTALNVPTPMAIPSVAPIPISSDVVNPAAQQDQLVTLYDTVSPGIVAIQINSPDGGALGSGFVFDSEGRIVTNYHVVEGAQTVEVDFMSGYKTYGTVIGSDLDSDLAIIEVDVPAGELHPLPLGDSEALKVGQTVIAIGNPFGLNGTMTVGIISALGRTLDSVHATPDGSFFTAGDIIQTDAAINPGNSGGPLFNMSGEVIGVNRAIRTTNFTTTGEPINSGIGFAISVNIIKRVAPGLIADGEYDYPYLGISSMNDMSLEVIEALGLKSFTGAYVTSIVNGGPADKAGIKAGNSPTVISGLQSGGDLIVAIDGRPVHSFDEMLAYLITNKGPGDTVLLTVLRGEEKVDISLTLDKRPK
jgi:S1-C subfamily serine protease